MAHCPNKYSKEYHIKNRSTRSAKAKDWWEKSGRNNHLLRKYGISLSAYNEMLEEQNGVCAICYRPETARVKSLAVDHDHVTGKVRGLLCLRCNRNIVGDRTLELFERVVEYLKGY